MGRVEARPGRLHRSRRGVLLQVRFLVVRVGVYPEKNTVLSAASCLCGKFVVAGANGRLSVPILKARVCKSVRA